MNSLSKTLLILRGGPGSAPPLGNKNAYKGGPKHVPDEVKDELFAQGLDPNAFHDHAVSIESGLDAKHQDDSTWAANIVNVKNAMSRYPMIHATNLKYASEIVRDGLYPAHKYGGGLEFDKISGLDKTVFMRQGQAGGGGRGAMGVMIDQNKLDPNYFLVTKLGLMTLKADENTQLQMPGDHRPLVDEQLKPFRDSSIPLADLPDVQARLLIDGYERDHPETRGTKLDPARVVENDHGVMEVKYVGHIPKEAITAYFAGDAPISADGRSASDILRTIVPKEKLVVYHGDGLPELSRAYRTYYAYAP